MAYFIQIKPIKYCVKIMRRNLYGTFSFIKCQFYISPLHSSLGERNHVIDIVDGYFLTQTCCGHLNLVVKIFTGSMDATSFIRINLFTKPAHSWNFKNIMVFATTKKVEKNDDNNIFLSEYIVSYNIIIFDL